MEQSITYREMVVSDHPALRSLWEATPGLTIRKADSLDGFTAFLKHNPGFSYTAISNGDVVGGILGGYDGRFGSIHHLVVQLELRNQGVGRHLVKLCLAHMEQVGIEKCHLFINRDNSGGLKFWENQDWVERVDLVMASYTF